MLTSELRQSERGGSASLAGRLSGSAVGMPVGKGAAAADAATPEDEGRADMATRGPETATEPLLGRHACGDNLPFPRALPTFELVLRSTGGARRDTERACGVCVMGLAQEESGVRSCEQEILRNLRRTPLRLRTATAVWLRAPRVRPLRSPAGLESGATPRQ